jgi:hypothetical protein
MRYKLTHYDVVIDMLTGVQIPMRDDNADFQAFLRYRDGYAAEQIDPETGEKLPPIIHPPHDVEPADPLPVVIPNITMAQAQIMLLRAGMLDKFNSMIAAMPREVQILWSTATDLHRDNPSVNDAFKLAGISKEQGDQLFIDASKIK